ncbi:unnamed protein product [Parnassius apollo]|uniref:(apollo) hypothetical protein n=1 Tax=Parnassius apollo TaxID=110799 RepID=A0A8S3Y1F2_PARAO|nr:unnamed protein product [Parnassius apollo]
MYVSKLWYYEKLMFLKDQEQPYGATSSSMDTQSDDDSIETTRDGVASPRLDIASVERFSGPQQDRSFKRRKNLFVSQNVDRTIEIIGNKICEIAADDKFDAFVAEKDSQSDVTGIYFQTCAPRYVDGIKEDERIGTFGQCFIKSIPQGIHKMKAMKESNQRLNKFELTMDSFGWSIDVTTRGDILIGGPAMTKGRVIRYKNVSQEPQLITPPPFGFFQNNNTDTFNFGYSIASGNFFSNSEDNIAYAVSTPYGNIGIGQVLFYSKNGKYINIIQDKDSGLGTLFGAALCTVKLGGKRTSLLVGAPAYIPEDAHGFDLGAVHIFMPNYKSLTLKTTIRGQSSGGRFGSAIINIGDLDNDQKDDVAIGAPYEDDGKGAVYIYTSNNILNNKNVMYSQRIQPEAFRTFGLSMTALRDYDHNGCNEIAIGAPDSNAVAIFNCFSSVTLNVFTVLPNLQNRESAEKEKITFKSCLNVSYPEKPENIVANIVISIGIMHPSARLENSKNGVLTYTESLSSKKNVYCKYVGVMTPLDKDKELNSIQITVNAHLDDDPRQLKVFDPQRVILSERSSLSTFNTIWASGCSSTICVPILSSKFFSSMTSPYIIGSSDAENISVTIANSGETAYSACVRIRVDSVRVLQAPGCRRYDDKNLICEPRNPVRTKQSWKTGHITLETKSLTSADREITVDVDVHNHCENETDNTSEQIVISLERDTSKLVLMRESIPDEVVNITSINLETEISHLYTIINNGVTHWTGVECKIFLNNSYVKFKYPIIIYTDNQKRELCYVNTEMKNNISTEVICNLGEIRKNQKVYIMVSLMIEPMPTDIFDVDKNISIATKLNLQLNYEEMTVSVSSTLVRVPIPKVSIWIYICAGVVALLVIFVLVIIFYECGFLQRKNKEMLKNLKQDVRRQSMRRTILLRESMRASQNQTAEDVNHLIDPIDTRSDGNVPNAEYHKDRAETKKKPKTRVKC